MKVVTTVLKLHRITQMGGGTRIRPAENEANFESSNIIVNYVRTNLSRCCYSLRISRTEVGI